MGLYKAVIKIISPIVKVALRMKVIDERATKEYDGNFIICANHLSNWDPIITVVVTGLPINFMAKESLFKVPFIGRFISAFGAFPVSKTGTDMSAIKKSVEIIKDGGCFSLFPQGTRIHVKPDPEQAKKGVGFICGRAEAGVLPIGIYTKDYRVKIFRKITVRIGDVIPYSEIDFGEDGKDYLKASQMVFARICELAQPEDENGD